jgi:hypothetical protein
MLPPDFVFRWFLLLYCYVFFFIALLFLLYRDWCFSKNKPHALGILCSLYSYAAELCGYSCCPKLCPSVLFYVDNIEVIGIHMIPLIEYLMGLRPLIHLMHNWYVGFSVSLMLLAHLAQTAMWAFDIRLHSSFQGPGWLNELGSWIT